MCIRETKYADLNYIIFVEHQAFNSNKEADLAKALLNDPTAKPLLSLMAFTKDLQGISYSLKYILRAVTAE